MATKLNFIFSTLDNKNNNSSVIRQIETQIETQTNEAASYAAVDLGSNSFHLVVSRYDHGEFTVVDRKKEVVRLAAGLDEDNNLSEDVSDRALQCLEQFGQLLRTLPRSQVRVDSDLATR